MISCWPGPVRSPTSSTPMRRWPSGDPGWPFSRARMCRCTRPRYSPRRFGSGCCELRMPKKARKPLWRSGNRIGSVDNEPKMSTGSETILLDVDAADHVATITLNRPAQLNAFNRAMCGEMAEAWRTVKLDDSVHAVVLRAAGTRAFSAGLDVKTPYGQPENIWNHEDPG